MKTSLFLLFFALLFSLSDGAYSQCRWKNVDTLDFENTLVDTGIVASSVYHTSPQTYGVRTGTRGLYFNIQNGPPAVPAGAMLYHRTFPVCPGRPYAFSFYYTTCFNGILCDINVKLYDGTTLINNFNSGPIPTQNWQQYLPPTFIPTNAFIKVEIYTNVAGSGGGNDVGVDDMVLKGCTQLYANNYFLCSGNSNYNLYDSIPLTAMNNTSGAWTGPSTLTNGYSGTYNPATNTNGVYTYTYNAPSNRCFADSAKLTVNTIVCGNTCPLLSVSNDTTVCANITVPLHASISTGTMQSVVWSPAWGLSNANIANPTTVATIDTTYQVTVTTVSPTNLIANGDFSGGNASFTSAYTYCSASVPPTPCVTSWGLLSCPGFYTINTNPNNCHTNFSTFGDHTSGTGNMLVVNGATNPNISVWCQTVPVQPNTNYNLSAWFSNVDPFSNAASLAVLSYTINGIQQGATFTPVLATGTWTNHTITWNSGANTTANICIQNSATFAGGNDFALDDIAFNATCTLIDSVHITVNKKPTVTFPNDTSFCNSVNLVIQPTVTGTPTPSLVWQNSSTNPSFTATTVGTYSMTATNLCGSAIDSMHILLTTAPTSVDLGLHQTICNQASFTLTPNVTGSSIYYLKWQDSSTTATYSATATGTYFVRVYNGCGSVWDTVTLTFKTSPTVNLGPNLTLCNQISYVINPTVTGSAQVHFKWQDSSITNTYNALATGLYYIRAYNECGSVWDTVRITFKTSPTVSLGNPVSLCDQASYTLTPLVTGTPTLSYKWQDSSTATSFTATSNGIYYVRVNNACGSAWDTVSVRFNFSPTVTLGADKLLCDSSSHWIFPVVTGTAPLTYQWQNGAPTTNFLSNQSGNYILGVSNACGSKSDTVKITFAESPTLHFTPKTYKQCGFMPITLNPIVSGTSPLGYSWNTGAVSPSIAATTGGLYILNLSNICKTVSDTVQIQMISIPGKIYDGATIAICQDSVLILNAGNTGCTYVWNTHDTIQKIVAEKAGVYVVHISNQHFCNITDSVTVKTIDCNPGVLVMPNAFSPNGDGLNDRIAPILVGDNVKLRTFRIFDRWGVQIFIDDEKNQGWDGKYNGVDQPLGTYIYVIDYINLGVQKSIKGDITLVR